MKSGENAKISVCLQTGVGLVVIFVINFFYSGVNITGNGCNVFDG